MKKLYGIVCASVTPMEKDGSIDHLSLQSMVDHLAQSGIHCIYPTGTNGEGILLTDEEQHEIAETVIRANGGRMSAFIQCGTVNWQSSIKNTEFACQAGADGVGVMTPVFYKADDAVMREYYREICRAAGEKPVYLYNISKYTNNDISPEVFGRIMDENPNAVGIKYSARDIMRIQDYLRASKTKKADVLIGADSLILSALAAGCVGAVSGPACVFPRWYVGVYEAFIEGDCKKALEYQDKIAACSGMIRQIPQIPAIKAMLKMKGVIRDDMCRRPFRRLEPSEYKILEHVINIYERDVV